MESSYRISKEEKYPILKQNKRKDEDVDLILLQVNDEFGIIVFSTNSVHHVGKIIDLKSKKRSKN